MDIAIQSAVDRIARVLAGQHISANAGGNAESAGSLVDAAWPDYRDDAIAVLKTLREPSRKMADVGDAAIWERMILAAIEEAKPGITM